MENVINRRENSFNRGKSFNRFVTKLQPVKEKASTMGEKLQWAWIKSFNGEKNL